jgi:molecular chaperone DnaK
VAAIGIDLGTSNSCVAVARRGRVDVLPNAYGEAICPSVVYFSADGSTQVGHPAKARAIQEPENTIAAAKRLLGRYFFSEEVKKAKAVSSYQIVEGANHAVRVKVREQTLAIPEISAFVLREMKNVAEAQLGQPVNQAVITVPAYFNDNQRQATRDAGRIAGLEVLRLLNEPTAAALAYGFGKGLTQRVAVYDLGGGTFDISILEIGSDIFEVLSTCGDTFLGGEDFDDRVIDLLADEFTSRHKINLRQDRFALEKLKAAAEQAKRDLSIDDEARICIADVTRDTEGNALELERRLSRNEFSNLVADLIQRTFKVCDEALQQANLTVRDLDGVILVGGPTRLPLIREAVSQYFQCDPKADVDPDQVVAMGAAIHAASLVGEEKDSCLLDVTPLSLRIGVAGGLAETVIDRNTPVPIEQTASFTTFKDFQQSVKIRVYQGESRVQEENELLGEFEFSGFKHARRGEVRIDVTFEIDTDGIVNVTARDPDTAQVASTQIHLSSGLSDDEIQAIVQKHQPAPADETAPAPRSAAEAIAALPRRVSQDPPVPVSASEPAAAARPDEAPGLLVGNPDALLQGADSAEQRGEVRSDELEPSAPTDPTDTPFEDPGAMLGAGAEFDLDLGANDGSDELELAPLDADPAPNDSRGDGRTLAIGGEIDLEALDAELPLGDGLGGDDIDLEPLALDETDLDSLASLSDDLGATLDRDPADEEDAMASTRPRGEAAGTGADPAGPAATGLFGDPGEDLSVDPGDDES